ncbi:MAG: hypothetical protein J6Z11_08015 [Candidatus Riflebacteria bacterium]|nr:hypothetical protein [Candidatus Riflebacteria bacterium]
MEIENFISGLYEKKINMKMMYYDYIFPNDEVTKYVYEVCKIPIENIVKYILTMPTPQIEAKDVFQFSNFDDATIRLCRRIAEKDNPGFKHIDVGKLLLNDGKIRKDGAYTKYGENHAKTGVSLGLIQELSKTYFLSCIGNVYPNLEVVVRNQLLTRLILRNSFVGRLICMAQNGNVNMRQFLYMLSDSTYKRRMSNIKCILKQLCATQEYDFSFLYSRIYFVTKENAALQ